MHEIYYIDRITKKREKEKVYGAFFLELLYGDSLWKRILSFFILPLFSRFPFFSRWYGTLQKSRWTKRKIRPFIRTFQVDEKEFLEPSSSFCSFNDFFIRKLKPSSRPLTPGKKVAILPADGRYLAYSQITQAEEFLIKGKTFSLQKLLQDEALAKKYAQGSLVIARLCPVDYHRFHFPCACIPKAPQAIPGPLFSVNPIALRRNWGILGENKRVITRLDTEEFGEVLYLEIGATYVGTIHQTFTPHQAYKKGEEKGYFSFGGSCLVLLFEPSRIQLDQDLLEASRQGLETRGLLGQSLGLST